MTWLSNDNVALESVLRQGRESYPCWGNPRSTPRWIGSGHRVIAVDPVTLTQSNPNQVGELWVRGPSVPSSYWGLPDESAATFEGRLTGTKEGPFLRTGDLGFVADGEIYLIEVNPRASRTIPFVSKATGIPLARIAAQVMAGKTLRELGLIEEPPVDGYWVKEVALPFVKFQGVDTLLGPEMKSTGESMGVAQNFGWAFAKALAHRQPRYRAMAENWGITVPQEAVEQVKDTEGFVSMIADALEMRG